MAIDDVGGAEPAPGTALWATDNEEGGYVLVLHCRSRAEVDAFARNPPGGFRVRVVWVEEIPVVLLVFWWSGIETVFVNASDLRAGSTARTVVEHLAEADELRFPLMVGASCIAEFAVANPPGHWRHLLRTVPAEGHWTAADFQTALDRVVAVGVPPADLWRLPGDWFEGSLSEFEERYRALPAPAAPAPQVLAIRSPEELEEHADELTREGRGDLVDALRDAGRREQQRRLWDLLYRGREEPDESE